MNWFRNSPSSYSSFQKLMASLTFGYAGSPVDTASWLEAFKSHWSQAFQVLQQNPTPTTIEHVTTVNRHLDQMITLLLAEVNSQTDTLIGPIMDFLFEENILEKVVLWMSFAENDAENLDLAIFCKRNMLKLFEGLLNQCQQCLLVHKPILKPILELIEDCNQYTKQDSDIEKSLVLLLNQICVKITDKDQALLLDFFFNSDFSDGSEPKFLIFSLLIPYLYEAGNVGQLAKDALLLILAVSRRVETVGRFISQHSNFCPVLATGLSALFSSLPRRLETEGDDWHKITAENIESNTELGLFFNALEFCNAVAQVGHQSVVDQLLDFIYNGFLVSVMGPALLDTSVEELIAATAYLELIFRVITEIPLMKTMLKFIITEKRDNVSILDHLVTRISSNSRLAIVSLALFETLLNLHCEDLMFELVFKYLLPCTHLMVSQTSSNYSMDVGQFAKSADKFFSLIPRCCAQLAACNAGQLSSASSAGSLDTVGTVGGGVEKPIGQKTDQSATILKNNGDTNIEIVCEYDAESCVKPVEIGYLEYLTEARCRLQWSYEASTCWSVPYDGKTPDPLLFRTRGSSSSSSSSSTCSNDITVPENILEANSESDQPLKRNSSYRKSRTNRYYNARHGSLTNSVNGNGRPSLRDLALGERDFGIPQTPILFEGNESALTEDDQKEQEANLESAPSSNLSTPRYKNNKLNVSMPSDYLKLSYDDESLMNTNYSDSESDAAALIGGGRWVLRGWSQIQDFSTFVEILNRVRPSHSAMAESIEQIAGYINGVYDLAHKSADPINGLVDHGSSPSFNEEKKQCEELIESKDSGFVDQAGGDCDEQPHDFLITNANLQRSSFSSPDIGPFLSILLHKLENMLQNSLFTNLHLTGLISTLACYPQPLLTSFLLNSSLVFQPSVRSLHQVLAALRHKVDAYACTVENFESLFIRGQKFLYQRDKRFNLEQKRKKITNFIEPPSSTDDESSRKSRKTEKKGPLSQFFNRHATRSRDNNQKQRSQHRSSSGARSSSSYRFQHQRFRTESPLESAKTKNIVYCAIILEEFLKELAAISHEHSLHCP